MTNLRIDGLSEEYVTEILRLHRQNNFARLLGVDILVLGDGYCSMGMTAGEHCANPYGGVHGGVTATLADMAMGLVLRTIGLQPATAELTVNYLGPVNMGDELVAEGRLVHRGGRLILTDCVVTSHRRAVARGRGLFVTRGGLISRG